MKNDRVNGTLCSLCPFADNGTRTIEPRRLDSLARGLGDTIADGLHILGVRQKPDCTCPARQSWLNQAVSYESLPSLVRDAPWWLRWPLTSLCRVLGIKTGLEPQRILFRFPHGFGDAVQFTVALRHLLARYPQNTFDVACKHGAETLFEGLADVVYATESSDDVHGATPDRQYDWTVNVEWHEPCSTYPDSPATKAEHCLRGAFGLTPKLELCRYQINTTVEQRERAAKYLAEIDATGRAFVFHYQGNTVPGNKTLDEQIVTEIIRDVVLPRGLVPIVLDWDKRSCFTREPANWPGVHNPGAGHSLWNEQPFGDGGTMAALIGQASYMLGIDSGPGHVAGATETPTLIVWVGHHPVNYYGLSPNVTHVIQQNHGAFIYGDRATGEKFFAEHYNAIEAQEHYRYSLPKIVAAMLDGVDLETVAPRFCYVEPPELIEEAGHWIRPKYRDNDLGMIREVHESDDYHLAELPDGQRYVVDVGAHIGAFATAIRPKLDCGGQVVCVEVNAGNLEALQRNAAGCRIRHAAVTYERDVVLLNSIFDGASAGPGDSEVVPAAESRSRLSGDAGRHLVVEAPECLTIEQLADEYGLPWIDILKLDCEGSEWSILEGMTCQDSVRLIVGEYHRGADRLREIAASRFPCWELRILSSKLPDYDDGAFWLRNTLFALPAL